MAQKYGKGKTAIESDDQQKLRWQVELEFVQCLANPNYLNFLAQRGYFKDQAFINYLKYLQYWKEPEYAKYLMYPMCLYFLDLLQYEHFRREIVSAQCCKFIDEQAILQWQHYTRKRVKMLNAVNENAKQADLPTAGAAIVASGATNMGNETTEQQQQQQQQQTTAKVGNTAQNGQEQQQQQSVQQQQQQMNGLSTTNAVAIAANIKLELS